MDLIKIMKERRSIRAYLPTKIEREKLNQIIEAALWAPSSHNSQPWHFTVINNEGLGQALNEATKAILIKSENTSLQKLGQRPDLFYGAPTLVVVSGKSDLRSAIIDCSAATQNMILAAEMLGLGTCWNGLVTNLFMQEPNHPTIQALNIPEGYTPFYAVAVGYYERKQDAPLRKGHPVNFIDC